MTEIVVTGLGVVTPIGTGIDDFWEALMAGASGAGPIQAFDTEGQSVTIACEIPAFNATDYMSGKEIARTDRFTHLGVAASRLAWEDAGLAEAEVDRDRIGVVIGSGIGGLSTIEKEHSELLAGGPRRVSPYMVPKLMPNAAAGAAAMQLGCRGPSYATASACATGAHAIGDAAFFIQNGIADIMLAGGSEAAITPLSLAAFSRMGALSRRNDDPQHASRPFDKGRDGFVMGEGAGIVVLESRESADRRGARVLARLAGYGATADAYHVTQPDPDGVGGRRAMADALAGAGATAEEVDYVNAHGTSTQYNDRVETIAIKAALGVEAKRIPVSSTKSHTGHLLGAAGAVEAAVCVLAIERGMIPPTINFEDADPDCDLDYVTDGPRPAAVKLTLSNSFGFGGQNACLAFRAPVE